MLRPGHHLRWLWIAALLVASPASAKQITGSQATLGWSTASGPVIQYAVFESRNGAAYPSSPSRVVAGTSTVVQGSVGDTVLIRVAAMDAQGNQGPLSAVSESVVFVAAPPPPPGGGGSGGGGDSGSGGGGSSGGGDSGSGGGGSSDGSDAGDPGDDGADLGTVDLDSNGTGDLLLYHAASGYLVAWLMDGETVSEKRPIGRQADSALQPVDLSDFDGDGQADLLWRDDASGRGELWRLRGTSVAKATLPTQGPEWKMSGCRDLDGDGITDIVWSHADGSNEVWYLNTAGRVDQQAALDDAPAGYQLAAVGDLDGDGAPDLVWKSSGGAVEWWKMNGASPTAVASLPSVGSGDHIAEVADLDGDGVDDLVWELKRTSKKKKKRRRKKRRSSTTWYLDVWYMNGMAAPERSIATASRSRYELRGLVDLDADGQLDLAVRTASGSHWGAEVERRKIVKRSKKKKRGRKRKKTVRWALEWNAAPEAPESGWQLLAP